MSAFAILTVRVSQLSGHYVAIHCMFESSENRIIEEWYLHFGDLINGRGKSVLPIA